MPVLAAQADGPGSHRFECDIKPSKDGVCVRQSKPTTLVASAHALAASVRAPAVVVSNQSTTAIVQTEPEWFLGRQRSGLRKHAGRRCWLVGRRRGCLCCPPMPWRQLDDGTPFRGERAAVRNRRSTTGGLVAQPAQFHRVALRADSGRSERDVPRLWAAVAQFAN